MSVVSSLRALTLRRLREVLWRRPVSVRLATPIVSFSFDDVPRSAAREGAAILERHGARGTYFVSGSHVGGSDGVEPMVTLEDLVALSAAGHEVACHSFGHERHGPRSRTALREDLERNARLLERVPGVTLDSFAYPYGEATIPLKREASRRYLSARGIRGGVNAGRVDLALVRANRLYGPVPDEHATSTLMGEAFRRGGWVVFYTHDVRERPSAVGCSPAHLQRILERVVGAGAIVLPMAAAARAILAAPENAG